MVVGRVLQIHNILLHSTTVLVLKLRQKTSGHVRDGLKKPIKVEVKELQSFGKGMNCGNINKNSFFNEKLIKLSLVIVALLVWYAFHYQKTASMVDEFERFTHLGALHGSKMISANKESVFSVSFRARYLLPETMTNRDIYTH